MPISLFGYTLTRTRGTAPPLAPITGARRGGWYPWIVREPYTGAWQQNADLPVDTVIANPTVYACAKTIAQDVSKLGLRLVERDDDDIWIETSSPAFSPVLRKPNRYQVISLFVQQWLLSKLLHGNTYVLKQRDARGVVIALYVLNPLRVIVLVAPDGSVFYEIAPDVLAERTASTVVPASEIIHDVMIPLFHPLVGVSPIYACGYAASQGLTIQKNSASFFANGATPGGVILVPTEISDEQAKQLLTDWTAGHGGAHVGTPALLSGGMTYQPTTQNAVDSQLIDQLKWTDEKICSVYGMPPFLVGVGPLPPYANFEPAVQQYYGECLQPLINTFEQVLDDGLGLLLPINGTQYGTEFDIDDLIWLDTDTRAKAAQQASGTLSPNETRKKFYGYGPVKGGDSPMVQQQYYSLDDLATRSASDPFAKPPPPPPAPQPDALTPDAIAASIGPLIAAAWGEIAA